MNIFNHHPFKSLQAPEHIMKQFEYQIKVPKERVGVLIGEKGEKKRELEEVLGVKLDIDSQEGAVRLIGNDSIKLYTAQEIVKAIARGFNPTIALLLLKTEYMFELITLTQYARSRNQLVRLKGRVIGENGKSRETIEELSETHIVVYGKTIGIIGDTEAVTTAQKAVDMLLTGAPHATVFRILERWRRDKRRRELEETYESA